MRRLGVCLLALSLVASGAFAAQGRQRDRPLSANPSAFVAAEIALARLAQEKGQWAAFRERAHPDAVLFVPRRVAARDWLKRQKGPVETARWQAHAVYVSCDGNAGATTGAWQAGTAQGYFTTVWLRDPRKGEMRWVLTHSDAPAPVREAGDFIETRQAACGAWPDAPAQDGGAEGEDVAVGLSPDRTLSWTSAVRADASRRVTIRLWNGSEMATVIDDAVAAP
ncbi:MAG: hypothetical protein CVT74_07085 [Alphaproteobacteria bacterium HGW-Alphaproteobacteria-13]|jgi:hypothetical protein|nr:MAG: hypothetical protein CVT74_07085 [Alphaproteobacteria bacterium HGW-Alphaproteobacteria-13]